MSNWKTIDIKRKDWNRIQRLLRIRDIDREFGDNLLNPPLYVEKNHYELIDEVLYRFDKSSLSVSLESNHERYYIHCKLFDKDGKAIRRWTILSLDDNKSYSSPNERGIPHYISFNVIPGDEDDEDDCDECAYDFNKEWYTISFSAKLSEEDVRAMRKYFFDTMNESMEIYDLANFKMFKEVDADEI